MSSIGGGGGDIFWNGPFISSIFLLLDLTGSILKHTQSQKTQGFCVADIATLSDEGKVAFENFSTVYMDKRTLRSKFEGLERSKLLGISQTTLLNFPRFLLYYLFLWSMCARAKKGSSHNKTISL